MDKKVKITGEVEVKHGEMTAMLAEVREFKEGWQKTSQEMVKTVASMSGVERETKDAAASTEKLAASAGKASGMVKSMEDSTKKTSTAAKALGAIWQGLWQGVGLGGVLGVAGAVSGLIGWLKLGVVEASRLDAIFEKMGARGVKNINGIKVSVAALAALLKKDLVQVAESVNLAEELGAGTSAVAVATAAWRSFAITGGDVNRTIQVSSRLVKAFNLDVREQAGLIDAVARASQQVKVSQDTLMQGMSTLAPMMKQVGGSWKELIEITKAAGAGGIKIEEEGPAGLRELFSQLISSSDDFGKNLVRLGVITTQSGPEWSALTELVKAQKEQFEQLNNEIKNYERQSQAIGLLTSETQRNVNQYERLNQKRSEGERLSRDERRRLRDLRDELEANNKALKEYDKAGMLVANSDFRRLELTEQLKLRLASAGEAQADLNEKTARMKFETDDLGTSLDAAQAKLSPLEEKLKTEIPAAIKEAIGEQGFGAFVQKLSEFPEVMEPLTAEVKTFVQTVGPALNNATFAAQNAGTQLGTMAQQFATLQAAGTNAIESLQTAFNNLRTILLSAVSESVTQAAAVMLADMEAVVNGDMSLGEMLKMWLLKALKFASQAFAEWITTLVPDWMSNMMLAGPELQTKLEQYFRNLASAAVAAFRAQLAEGFSGLVNKTIGAGGVGKLFDLGFAYDGLGGFGGNDAGSGGAKSIAPTATSAPMSRSSSFTQTNNISGSDPAAIVDELTRRQQEMQRLGRTGTRL